LLIAVIGNLMYGVGYVTDKWVVLVGRFLVGFGSGTLAPIRAAIADITTTEQRVRYMALSNAVQFIGFAIVPGLAALLTLVDFYVGGLRIDRYSSAGFVLAFISIPLTFQTR
jgi:MFS family permease